MIGDGNLGIWRALRNVWPEVEEQRCWKGCPRSPGTSWGVPEVLKVLEQLPRQQQAATKPMLRPIAYAPTRAEAEGKRREFEQWRHRHGYGKAAETLGHDWERMVTFYRYPKEHWRHLRTTNVVESPLAALRLRTDAAKRFKKVEPATAAIWKMLIVAQKRFRRLNAPELLAKVYAGVQYEHGVELTTEEVAA